MRARSSFLFSVLFAGTLACMQCTGFAAEEKTAPKAGVEAEQQPEKAPADPPDTEANRALNAKISIEKKNISLEKMLKYCDDQGVQYIVNTELVEDNDIDLAIKVKDIPLREVIDIAARACGLRAIISPSGIVTLSPDPEQAELRRMQMQNRMMDRFREFRNNRGERGDRQRMDRGERRRPENDEQGRAPEKEKEDEADQNDGVF